MPWYGPQEGLSWHFVRGHLTAPVTPVSILRLDNVLFFVPPGR